MTICRYFLQGKCRFGDRCRFEHIQAEHEFEGGYRKQNYPQERYSRYDQYSHEAQRYNSPNRYNEHESERGYRKHNYSQERHSRYDQYSNEAQRYNSPNRYNELESRDAFNRYKGNNYNSERRIDGGENDRYDSPARYDANYRYLPKRYTPDSNFVNNSEKGVNDSRYFANARNENANGQNRFHWVSDDYKSQHQQTPQYNKTSTPKSNVAFSFKQPDSEIKETQHSANFQMDEEDEIYFECVKEDARAWELGKQWPFTCYFPCTDKPGFPGFTDISPEELRYEAYKAKENNIYDSYCESVNNALQGVNLNRTQLKIPSVQLINILKKIRKGEHIPIQSAGDALQFLFHNNQSSAEKRVDESFVPKNSTSTFSFKLPSETDSAVKTSASIFSFKLAPENDSKQSSAGKPPQGSSNDYTTVEELSEAEKEQFLASTFTLGKIPTKPPASVYCV